MPTLAHLQIHGTATITSAPTFPSSSAAAGVKATIVMPTTTPLVKVNNTKDYGANVVLHGEVFDDAAELAAKLDAKRASDAEKVLAKDAKISAEYSTK